MLKLVARSATPKFYILRFKFLIDNAVFILIIHLFNVNLFLAAEINESAGG